MLDKVRYVVITAIASIPFLVYFVWYSIEVRLQDIEFVWLIILLIFALLSGIIIGIFINPKLAYKKNNEICVSGLPFPIHYGIALESEWISSYFILRNLILNIVYLCLFFVAYILFLLLIFPRPGFISFSLLSFIIPLALWHFLDMALKFYPINWKQQMKTEPHGGDIMSKAELGYPHAQFNLGVMYADGECIPQDNKQAVYWFTKATENGYVPAQYNLGVMYADGKGVKQDYEQAIYWYTKAADQGLADAQYNLGVMYAGGKGVKQDYEQAIYWYTRAARQGLAAAQCNLGEMYANGKGITQDYNQAFYLYTKAAKQGLAAAQCNLGEMLRDVLQDSKKAFYWFTKAAEQGDAVAQFYLGVIYLLGEGIRQNNTKAYAWFNISASQGHEGANQNKNTILKMMSPSQIEEGEKLSRELHNKIYKQSN